MRRRGVLIVLATVLLTGAAAGAYLAAGQPELLAFAVQQVAPASAVTRTTLAGTLYARDGADRLLQRERTGHPCGAAAEMGCPPSTPLRSVPVFLVRDSANAIRAFVAQDPRNGCVLNWRTDVSDGAFYDTCHGSLYDRQGRRIGGPSPWNLNEWAVVEKDGAVFIDPTKILTGAAPGFYPRLGKHLLAMGRSWSPSRSNQPRAALTLSSVRRATPPTRINRTMARGGEATGLHCLATPTLITTCAPLEVMTRAFSRAPPSSPRRHRGPTTGCRGSPTWSPTPRYPLRQWAPTEAKGGDR